MNFITLWRETKDELYLGLADALIDEVHNVLGRDRFGSLLRVSLGPTKFLNFLMSSCTTEIRSF